ncbi:MAG: hypothetical protein GF310_11270 [candidate division Zixibacteria bacterium]|nr:hypothetical protein [candidate division Zixibacteria bacterium]
MPGLFGIIDLDKKPEAELFGNIASGITPFEYKYLNADNENCRMGFKSLGIVDPQGQPFHDEDNSLTLFFWGEIFERDTYSLQLPKSIFEIYMENRLEEISEINGFFSFALWDNSKKTLVLATDIHGIRPLYYHQGNDFLAFGPNPFALAKALNICSIDKDALLQFMAFGKIIEDHTWIDGIKKLRYGQILQFDQTGLNIKQYFKPQFRPVKMSIDDAAEGILKGLEKGITRMSEGKAALSLSGGGDSRLLAALLKKNKIMIPAFSFGGEKSDDMKIASEVCEHLEIPHHRLTISPDFLQHHLREAVYNTGGFVSALNYHGISTRERVREFGDICLSGLYGNNYLGYLSRFLYLLSRINPIHVKFEMLRKLLSEGQELDSLERLLNFTFDRDELEKVAYSLIEYYGHESPLDTWMMLDHFEINSQSSLAGFWLENDLLEFRTPYCDRDLLEFNFSIPVQYKVMMNLGRYIWNKYYPGLGRINHQRTGLPINASVRKLIVQKIATRILKKRRPAGIMEYSAVFEHEIKEWIHEFLLSDNSRISQYLNMDTAAIRIGAHTEFDTGNAAQIGLLLTFEQVLRILECD